MLKYIKKIYTNSPQQNFNDLLYKLKKKETASVIWEWNNDLLEGISLTFENWVNRQRTNYADIDFTEIEFFEENILQDIDWKLQGKIENTNYEKCEMSYKDRAFLNGIIRKTKPKTVVEIGLSAGGSTCVLLNAIKDFEGTKLYSFDYNTNWYRDEELGIDQKRKTGFLVDQIVPSLVSKWDLYTGGVPCNYFDVLPNDGIDICFIDTAHFNPGEHLNILEILPFMKENGIIIYHDTVYHSVANAAGSTNCVSLNSLKGDRITMNSENTNGLANIGAIVLDKDVENMLDSLFSNLSLPWYYRISKKDFVDMLKHFSKHYALNHIQIYIYYSCFYMNGGLGNKKNATELAESSVNIFRNNVKVS